MNKINKNMPSKKTIAVFFGGRSPEHDISVITGLQILQAIDSSAYNVFPVYLTIDGTWLIGEALLDRNNYLPDANIRKKLTAVTLDLTHRKQACLLPTVRNIFSKNQSVNFDIALLAFHGLKGEDGQIQGVFETANIPYTGMRTLASSVLMDKAATKNILAGTNIPLLPHRLIEKPKDRLLLNTQELTNITDGLTFPCCVKPCHLGSSIGVAKVMNPEELNAVLPNIFKYDATAIVEPFVENLVEYNIAVRRKANGEVATSAIERPKCTSELLDFKTKYLPGDKTKCGSKTPGAISQGMLSLTREINPTLDSTIANKIQEFACTAFTTINGNGVPRIDFLCNSKTNELWLNEINPCPGSFGYFLWEAAKESLLFTELAEHLIAEATQLHDVSQLPPDPVPAEAMLLKRR
jgi:D-alanine-D-alanine ligase